MPTQSTAVRTWSSTMESLTVEQAIDPRKRPPSVQVAMAALIILAAGNALVLVWLMLDGSFDTRDVISNTFGWFFVVMLLVTAIRLWCRKLREWRGIQIGAAVIGVICLAVPIIGTLNGRLSEMWPAYVFIIGESAFLFVVYFSLRTHSARAYVTPRD